MNGLTTAESRRRAVAPIIATLLMVAIAVVGGILIFVFTQGFFSEGQVVGPMIDNIRIVGYGAVDSDTVIAEAESADGTLTCASGDADNRLNTDDCFTLFIENLGDKAAALQSVRIYGETHNLSTTGATGACPTSAGFAIYDSITPGAVISVIDPNELVTVCVHYDGSSNAIKQGRTIPVQVETSNGQSSQINIINGALRGQR